MPIEVVKVQTWSVIGLWVLAAALDSALGQQRRLTQVEKCELRRPFRITSRNHVCNWPERKGDRLGTRPSWTGKCRPRVNPTVHQRRTKGCHQSPPPLPLSPDESEWGSLAWGQGIKLVGVSPGRSVPVSLGQLTVVRGSSFFTSDCESDSRQLNRKLIAISRLNQRHRALPSKSIGWRCSENCLEL